MGSCYGGCKFIQCVTHSQTFCVLQLFEYILEYLRTVRFGEPDHSLALPADQTELAQIVREVNNSQWERAYCTLLSAQRMLLAYDWVHGACVVVYSISYPVDEMFIMISDR